jgi:hypothetical protein
LIIGNNATNDTNFAYQLGKKEKIDNAAIEDINNPIKLQ